MRKSKSKRRNRPQINLFKMCVYGGGISKSVHDYYGSYWYVAEAINALISEGLLTDKGLKITPKGTEYLTKLNEQRNEKNN